MCSTSDSQQNRRRAADGVAQPAGTAQVSREVGDGDRGRRELLALQRLAEHLAQLRQLVIVDYIAEFDDALIHPAGLGDDHHQQAGRCECDHFQMTNGRRRQCGVLHNGDLAGELGQQPYRTAQHVVEVDTGLQEALDRPPLGR